MEMNAREGYGAGLADLNHFDLNQQIFLNKISDLNQYFFYFSLNYKKIKTALIFL